MTPDEDDSSLTWRSPDNAGDQSDWDPDYDVTTPAQQAQVMDDDANFPTGTADDEDPAATKVSFFTLDSVRNFGRLFSPILIPLPFALFIFIVTYFTTYRMAHPNLQVLPMAILLLALAILQGTMLYYAGSNDDLWLLCLILGYALMLLVGAFAVFSIRGAIILLILMIFLALFFARRGFRQVSRGYVEIVHSFGKYSRTLDEGPKLLWPWEKSVQRVNIKEKLWTCPLQVVKISRDQDVRLIATISFKVLPEDAHLTLMVENWEESLHKLFVGTLQALVSQLSPADFTVWTSGQGTTPRAANPQAPLDPTQDTRWDRINNALASRTQDHVADWGVQVNWVRIQDITLIPHLMPATSSPPGMQPPSKRTMPAPGYAGYESGNQAMNQPTRVATSPAQSAFAQPATGDDQEPTVVMDSRTVQQQMVHPQPISVSNAPTALSSRLFSIEQLKELYEAVRQSRITDPGTIYNIADQFERIAQDPDLRQKADFDAPRAAISLRQRAKTIEAASPARAGSNMGR